MIDLEKAKARIESLLPQEEIADLVGQGFTFTFGYNPLYFRFMITYQGFCLPMETDIRDLLKLSDEALKQYLYDCIHGIFNMLLEVLTEES